MNDRLDALQARTGLSLPADYVAFLRQHRNRELLDGYVSTNPDYWGVREIFEIGDGPAHAQVDLIYEQLKDVLPPYSVPIAQDWAGNLYLIDYSRGGNVVWWSHERLADDHHVDKVADSFTQFVSYIHARQDS